MTGWPIPPAPSAHIQAAALQVALPQTAGRAAFPLTFSPGRHHIVSAPAGRSAAMVASVAGHASRLLAGQVS